MNIGGGWGLGVQAVEVLNFAECIEQWQRLVLSKMGGLQQVLYQKTNGNILIKFKY